MTWSLYLFCNNNKIKTICNFLSSSLNIKDLLILSISLVLLIIGSSFLFNSANEWVLWKYDDTEHLDISYNLLHGKGLTKEFIDLEANTIQKNIPTLQKYEDISNPLRSKLPFYFILLGSWLYINSANFTNWYFYGSIFNLILSSICIIVFYFFVKSFFGFRIASLSVPFLATLPSFLWFSVRVRPDVLAFIFILSSIYFASKNISIKNSILSGICVALAHLSHPIGLIPGFTIIIYYLLNKKIKETLILIGTWTIITAPWLIRNYIIFGDATQGFGLPIPRSILIAIGLISPNSTIVNVGDVGSLAGISIVNIFQGMINEFTKLYGMSYFLLLIPFSLVVYIHLPTLKRNFQDKNKKIFTLINIILYSFLLIYIILFGSDNKNILIQVLIIFIIPVSVFGFIKLFSNSKNIFSSKGRSVYVIIGLLVIISIIPYIMFAQIAGRSVPEIRIVIQSLYLMIPIFILGIWKILNKIYPISNKVNKEYLIITSITIIIFSISILQLHQGIQSINDFQKGFAEKDYQKELDEWITKMIPSNMKIASDLPHAVLLKSGHPSVNFAHMYMDNISYENWIIKKFDIDYLVFYYIKDKYPHELTNLDLGTFYLKKIYQGKEGGLVYEIFEK